MKATSVIDYEIVPLSKSGVLSPVDASRKALNAIRSSGFYDDLKVPGAEMHFYGNGNFSLGFVEGLDGFIRIADFGNDPELARRDAEFHLKFLANLRLDIPAEDLQVREVKLYGSRSK